MFMAGLREEQLSPENFPAIWSEEPEQVLIRVSSVTWSATFRLCHPLSTSVNPILRLGSR